MKHKKIAPHNHSDKMSKKRTKKKNQSHKKSKEYPKSPEAIKLKDQSNHDR